MKTTKTIYNLIRLTTIILLTMILGQFSYAQFSVTKTNICGTSGTDGMIHVTVPELLGVGDGIMLPMDVDWYNVAADEYGQTTITEADFVNDEYKKDILVSNSGVYRVTVYFNESCEGEGDVEIFSLGVSPVEAIIQNSFGLYQENGAITLFLDEDPANPYTYLWSNNDPTKNISGLDPGEYCVTISSTTCQYEQCYTVECYIIPIEFDATTFHKIVITDACTDDGSILIWFEHLLDNDEPLTYSIVNTDNSTVIWSGPLWTTSGIQSKLPAGNYTLTISYGTINTYYYCEDTYDFTIEQNYISLDPEISSSVTHYCVEYPGSIEINLNTEEYSFLWNDGQTTSNLTDLVAGEYEVTITGISPYNCQKGVLSFEILDLDMDIPSYNTEVTAICSPQGHGEIEIIFDPNEQLSVIWEDGTSGNVLTNIMEAGTYTATVTSQGCEFSIDVEIFNLQINPTFEFYEVGSPCRTGIKIIIPDIESYQIVWDNNLVLHATVYDNGSTHSVQVTEIITGCRETFTFTMPETNINIELIDIQGVVQTPESLGFIEINIFEDSYNGNYDILWNNGGTTERIEDLQVGQYFVTVTNVETECVKTDVFEILDCSLSNPIEFNVSVNSGYGYIWIIPSFYNGGTTLPPLNVNWYDENGNWFSKNKLIGNLSPGEYTAIIDDGCNESTETYTITDCNTLEAPDISFIHGAYYWCEPGDFIGINLITPGIAGQYTIQWYAKNNGNYTYIPKFHGQDLAEFAVFNSPREIRIDLIDEYGCIYSYFETLSADNAFVPDPNGCGGYYTCYDGSKTFIDATIEFQFLEGGPDNPCEARIICYSDFGSSEFVIDGILYKTIVLYETDGVCTVELNCDFTNYDYPDFPPTYFYNSQIFDCCSVSDIEYIVPNPNFYEHCLAKGYCTQPPILESDYYYIIDGFETTSTNVPCGTYVSCTYSYPGAIISNEEPYFIPNEDCTVECAIDSEYADIESIGDIDNSPCAIRLYCSEDNYIDIDTDDHYNIGPKEGTPETGCYQRIWCDYSAEYPDVIFSANDPVLGTHTVTLKVDCFRDPKDTEISRYRNNRGDTSSYTISVIRQDIIAKRMYINRYDNISYTSAWEKSYLSLSGQKMPSGAQPFVNARSTTIDHLNAIYVGGSYVGELTDEADINIESTGYQSAFVVKYDVYDEFEWIKNLTGNQYVDVADMKTNSRNELMVLGSFIGTTLFDYNVSLTVQDTSIFLARYDMIGQLQQVDLIESNVTNNMDMKIDANDKIIILANNNSGEIFIKHVNPDGSQIATQPSTYKGDVISKLELLREDSYVCLLQGKEDAITSNKSKIVYFDNAGNVIWEKSIGEQNNLVEITGIATSDENSFIIIGHFEGNLNIDPNISLSSIGGTDIFIAKLDLFGTVLWARQEGGLLNEYPAELSANYVGHYTYLGIYNSDQAVFSSQVYYSSDSLYQNFVSGFFDDNGNTNGLISNVVQNQTNNEIHVFPNPTSGEFNVRYPNQINMDKIQLVDLMGRILKEKITSNNGPNSNIVFDVQDIDSGIYFFKFINNNKCFGSKKIIKI